VEYSQLQVWSLDNLLILPKETVVMNKLLSEFEGQYMYQQIFCLDQQR